MFHRIDELFVPDDATIGDALAVLNRSGIGLVLVVDGGGRLTGTVTDGDVRRGLLRDARAPDLMDRPVSHIMHRDPLTAAAGTPASTLLDQMEQQRKRHLPIVEDGRVVDVVWKEQLLSQLRPEPVTAHAVIMCGGFGRRLRPLTSETPKPLLPVAGKPLLQYIIEGLASSGLREIYLAVRYEADQIEAFCGDGSRWNVELSYLREEAALGTAGALSMLADRLTAPTIVVNGDVMTSVKYSDLLAFHGARSAEMTVAVKPYDVHVPYGVVSIDGDDVSAIEEKPVMTFFTNAGIYVLEPGLLNLIPGDEPFDMPELIQRVLDRRETVSAFPIHEYWIDIGNHADYRRAQEDRAE